MNIVIPEFNQVSYLKKSLRISGPKLLNCLPYYNKSSENLESFKRATKNWNGKSCVCKVRILVNKLLFLLKLFKILKYSLSHLLHRWIFISNCYIVEIG